MQLGPKHILATSVFAAAWIVAVVFGLRSMLDFESTPGPVGSAPQIWPISRIQRANDRPTLVMLAHPRCPCTRASVGELAQIMARLQGKVSAYVLFFEPRQSNVDWKDTDLRRSAMAIPGVTVLANIGGLEARRFGAETSGQTLLFGADGRLLFSGGITESRGHAGGNAGESAVLSFVNNHTAERARTFVFGCPLTGREKTERNAQCLK